MLNKDAAARCAQVRGERIQSLWPCSHASAAKVITPRRRLDTRMLNGGLSRSAMPIMGQVTPQPRHNTIRKKRGLTAADPLGGADRAPGQGSGRWCVVAAS